MLSSNKRLTKLNVKKKSLPQYLSRINSLRRYSWLTSSTISFIWLLQYSPKALTQRKLGKQQEEFYSREVLATNTMREVFFL